MPPFLTTTTVTILRGSGTDHWGDDIETDAVVAQRVGASLLEAPGGRANQPVDGRTDTVRRYTLRLGSTVDLIKDDRVRDERTGDTYVVENLFRPHNPAGFGVVRADLLRVT